MKQTDFNDLVIGMLDTVRYEDFPDQPDDFDRYANSVFKEVQKVLQELLPFGTETKIKFRFKAGAVKDNYLFWFASFWSGCPVSEHYGLEWVSPTCFVLHPNPLDGDEEGGSGADFDEIGEAVDTDPILN